MNLKEKYNRLCLEPFPYNEQDRYGELESELIYADSYLMGIVSTYLISNKIDDEYDQVIANMDELFKKEKCDENNYIKMLEYWNKIKELVSNISGQ